MPSRLPGSETDPTLTRMRPALGCHVRLSVSAAAAVAEAAIAAGYAAIEAVEQAMSFHRPHSELQRLQRLGVGRDIEIDPALWEVLAFARELWQASGGAFDPAVARSLVADGLLPRPAGLPEPPADSSLADLELPAPGHARLRRPLWLDLGGLAKGHAVDAALAALRAAGASSASVNAGGDLACFGLAETLGLRDPRQPTRLLHRLQLRDGAIASSGAYFQPDALRSASGAPARRRLGGVSVLAPRCMTADALTKLVWLQPRRARRLLERYDAAALSIDGRGQLRWLRAPE